MLSPDVAGIAREQPTTVFPRFEFWTPIVAHRDVHAAIVVCFSNNENPDQL